MFISHFKIIITIPLLSHDSRDWFIPMQTRALTICGFCLNINIHKTFAQNESQLYIICVYTRVRLYIVCTKQLYKYRRAKVPFYAISRTAYMVSRRPNLYVANEIETTNKILYDARNTVAEECFFRCVCDIVDARSSALSKDLDETSPANSGSITGESRDRCLSGALAYGCVERRCRRRAHCAFQAYLAKHKWNVYFAIRKSHSITTIGRAKCYTILLKVLLLLSGLRATQTFWEKKLHLKCRLIELSVKDIICYGAIAGQNQCKLSEQMSTIVIHYLHTHLTDIKSNF